MTTKAAAAQTAPVVEQRRDASTELEWTQMRLTEESKLESFGGQGINVLAYAIAPGKAIFVGRVDRDRIVELNALSPDSCLTIGHGFTVNPVFDPLRGTPFHPIGMVTGNSPLSIAQTSSDADDRRAAELQRLEAGLRVIFDDARGEEFEFGMDSQFSLSLAALFDAAPFDAVEVLDTVLNASKKNTDVLIEALRQIGLIEHSPTRPARSRMLIQYLQNKNVRIRDAACLGLAGLDDPSAIPAMRIALNKETSNVIKELMGQVITQLENA